MGTDHLLEEAKNWISRSVMSVEKITDVRDTKIGCNEIRYRKYNSKDRNWNFNDEDNSLT